VVKVNFTVKRRPDWIIVDLEQVLVAAMDSAGRSGHSVVFFKMEVFL
jgi:ribosomal silencing factor RsfS